MKYLLIIFLVILTGCSSIINKKSEALSLKMPNKNWVISFDIPHLEYFMLSETHTETNNYANIHAVLRPDWALKITIGEWPNGYDMNKLIYHILGARNGINTIKQTDFKEDSSSYIQGFKGDITTAEYFIEDLGGISIQMKRKIICMIYDNVDVEIHIAKLHYTPEDEETFKKLINSIKIIED